MLIKITSKAPIKPILFTVLALLLTACGGGGGSSGSSDSSAKQSADSGNTDDNAPADQGVFVDSPVMGISYQTRNDAGDIVSGETGPNGEYPLYPGRNIYFGIGKLAVGTVAATTRTTPYSFVAPDSGEAHALNIARFLQTLDEDGNPDNGIVINSATRTAFTDTNKTFADNYFNTTDFAAVAESDIRYLLNNPDIDLVTAEAARAHLQELLATIEEQVVLPGTSWRTDYTPVYLSYFDESEKLWVTRRTCTDQDYGLYRIDSYDASRVTSTHWESFAWLPRCARTDQETQEQPREYDGKTLCGQKLAADANANLTVCTFADLNSNLTFEQDGMTVTVYSAYAPDSRVVYRTIYKEYYDAIQEITFREKWQSVTTQLLED